MTTEEPQTITAEEAIPLLQQQSADRLVFLRLYQACNGDIVARQQQLERDLAEYNNSIGLRNKPQQGVIPEEDEEESDDEEESESE